MTAAITAEETVSVLLVISTFTVPSLLSRFSSIESVLTHA